MTGGGAAAVIGREAEVQAVAELIDGGDASPRALVLEGEAGIGKSTLWEWGLERARERGHLLVRCRPAETEAPLPFSALGDLLEPILDTALPALPRPQRLALEVALQRIAPPEDPTDRLAVSRAVLAILRAPSNGTTTIAVDDLQWLDAPSSEVLAFALRRLADAPIRFLLSRRGAEGRLPLGLQPGFPVRRLHVGPLTVDELGRLLVARLDATLPRPLLAQLHGTTAGNPYFALEIVRSAKDRAIPLESGAALPVPESLGALLRERIAALSPAAADVVVLASASPNVSGSLFENVTGSGDGLAETLDHGILELDGERLRFTHPLLGSVAYSGADPVVRREAHRRLAAAIDDPDDRALHLALATEQPDETVAADLAAAAARAHHRGAPAAAAQLADHACRLTPPDRREELRARIVRSADYHVAAGATARARALLEQVVDAHPPGRERATLLLRLGRIRYAADDLTAAHALFGQALVEAGDDQRLAAHVEQALAFTAIGAGDLPLAVERARSSLALAQRLDDPGLLALALGRVAQAEFMAGGGVQRARLERALELEEYVEDVPVEWRPSYQYAGIAMFSDDLETSRRLHGELLRSAVEHGDEREQTSLLFAMSIVERWAGNLAAATRYADEAVERSRQAELAISRSIALSAQSFVSTLIGRVEVARAAAEEGIRTAREAGVRLPDGLNIAALGFLELSLGDPEAAHRHLGPLSEAIVAMGLTDPGFVRFVPDEIEALVALGELEAARELLGILEERALALDRISGRATAGRCRALLEAAAGDHDAARESLHRAFTQHERLGQPFELGRTLLVQGSIERRARSRAVARDALTQALDVFDTLGTPLWAEKAAAELARIPGRTRSSGELTETEQRVAELVAEGLPNKEIAARLFVTARTVEWNLSKVYEKLGIHSRTELASRLADRGAR